MSKASQVHYDGDSHTFVICAYQESPYLEECIQSLLDQTVPTQILMATSTANRHIVSLAGKYGIPLYVNQLKTGLAGDWNFALFLGGTPLVTLAHQDDRYDPEYVRLILENLNTCRHPLIAFTDYNELRDGKTVTDNSLLRIKRKMLSPLCRRSLWRSRFVRRRILSAGNAICCPAVTLVRENLPGFSFRDNMKSNIDWQAWEEISRKRGEFVYVPVAAMEHRIHEESTTSGLLEEHARRAEDIYMFRKFWPAPLAHLIELFYQKSEKSNKLD